MGIDAWLVVVDWATILMILTVPAISPTNDLLLYILYPSVVPRRSVARSTGMFRSLYVYPALHDRRNIH